MMRFTPWIFFAGSLPGLALAVPAALDDASTGDVPTGFTSGCNGVCTFDSGTANLSCRVDQSAAVRAGEIYLVIDYSGSAPDRISAWGLDDTGTAFGCSMDTTTDEVASIHLFGDLGNDWLLFEDKWGAVSFDRPSSWTAPVELVADGSAGNDVLKSPDCTACDTWLYGGDDDDIVLGSPGPDRMYGFYPVGHASYGPHATDLDELRGFGGADTIHGGPDADTICGGEGDDTIQGDSVAVSAGDDAIEGGGGSDTIMGGGGDDCIHGDVGSSAGGICVAGGTPCTATTADAADLIEGGTGDDVVYGGEGADELAGQDGNDVIHGGNQPDVIFGGDGGDDLRGEAGDDHLFGGDHPDTLLGGPGDDLLFGGSGDDELNGGTDHDEVDGGLGFDTVCGGGGGLDILSDPDPETEYAQAAGSWAMVLPGGPDNLCSPAAATWWSATWCMAAPVTCP